MEKNNLYAWIRIPLNILIFVFLGLFFGYLTFQALSFSRTVEVPDLQGKSLLESNKLVSDKGLYLKIEGEEYHSSIPHGHIAGQDVPPGKKVKEKRGIKVVISKGPRVTSVPSLTNETLVDAETLLIRKGLRIAKMIPVHSDTVEKGKIVAQRPDPDEPISDRISVLVSVGPHEQPLFCPDFVGMPIEEAKEMAGKLKLKAEVKGEGATVLMQKPFPGRKIKTGETILLKLS